MPVAVRFHGGVQTLTNNELPALSHEVDINWPRHSDTIHDLLGDQEIFGGSRSDGNERKMAPRGWSTLWSTQANLKEQSSSTTVF